MSVLPLTLNRPEKANALSLELIENLLIQIREGVKSHDVSVITLTGSGNSFCAGADLSEFKGSPEGPKKAVEAYVTLIETLVNLEKPFLVGVNGPAVGGGIGLAAMGDVVIASTTANFRTPELSLGLFPFIISPILVPIIGRRRFFEMVYTGRPVGADEALQWGLVNRVIPPDELQTELRKLADRISRTPIETLTRGKRAAMQGQSFRELGRELLDVAARKQPPRG